MNKTAAIFDMDGVLMDNNPWHVAAWIEFATRYGLVMTRGEVEESFGNTNRDYLLKLFGKPLTPKEIERMAEEKEVIYRDSIRSVMKPLTGLVPFLDSLRAAGFSIGIVTGGPLTNVEFVLSQLGIAGYFQTVVHDALVTRGKPDPEGYLLAAAMLGLHPSGCVVFEDSENGVLAATAAGMQVVGINTGGKPEKLNKAQLICSDFSNLTSDHILQLIHSKI
ncbi:MAG: HAD family phosphatase [Bacteroidales bacterium]